MPDPTPTLTDEQRMFAAEDIRDCLARVTDLSFGDRNRIAWHMLPLVARMVADAEQRALREAAKEVHREARWSHEMAMRGRPTDAVDRLLVVERILLDRADRIGTP